VDDDITVILAGIGPRLRALRQYRGLTLEALAEESGLSVSTLSRLEAGIRRPTLDLLIPLARTHRVALEQLVAAPATGDPRVHLRPHRHKRGSVVVPLTEYPGRVQVFKQVLAPREPRLVTHSGYEWLYVLAGQLRLILGARDVPWPRGLGHDAELGNVIEIDVEGWQDVCANLSLTHMGRHAGDDPWFFAAAFAAGRHARALLA